MVFRDEVAVSPAGSLDLLSRLEVSKLRDVDQGHLRETFRRCALAVLNCGGETDNARLVLDRFRDFEIELVQGERGIRLKLRNAPAVAFVDGKLIQGIREHLFSVLRDVLYVNVDAGNRFDFSSSEGITNAVFHILRNAGVVRTGMDPKLIVCWGGHSISRGEYDYTKEVGYQLGLRGLDVCTGCGPGAMKGPMKGAAVGHAKQRIKDGRYVGISEPGIIAAESPNPIVDELVIMPDIEKRLESFVRLGHGIVVFPGGAGTAEEILYLLGILLDPANEGVPIPVVLTGPNESSDYLKLLDGFLKESLGDNVASAYQIVAGDPVEVARQMGSGMEEVRRVRRSTGDAYYFNWRLRIDPVLQTPFRCSHEAMAQLDLRRDRPMHERISNLRRAFSGIVAGNVKDDGITAIEENGPFEIHGDPDVIQSMDGLLRTFISQGRMRLPGAEYQPCYRVIPRVPQTDSYK
jgi:predicted Rossmann-fold nucleotide-binding protein